MRALISVSEIRHCRVCYQLSQLGFEIISTELTRLRG